MNDRARCAQKFHPYLFPEANYLKFVSEFAILTVVVTTLAEHSLSEAAQSLSHASIFDAFLQTVLLGLVPLSALIAVCFKFSRVKMRIGVDNNMEKSVWMQRMACVLDWVGGKNNDIALSDINSKEQMAVRRAFVAYRCGVASVEERGILRVHFEEVQASVRVDLSRFLGSYQLARGNIAHQSSTSIVVFAQDNDTNANVAVKILSDAPNFERELRAYQDYHDTKFMIRMVTHERLAECASTYDARLCGHHVIVLERAGRSMTQYLSQCHISGKIDDGVRSMFRDVLGATQYLNETAGRVHGDVKPRNFVELLDGDATDGNLSWKVIDLASSIPHNRRRGTSKSSGFMPIESLRCLSADMRDGGSRCIEQVAEMSHDIYSTGVLLFQLCSKDCSTMFFCDMEDNIVKSSDVHKFAERWRELKHMELQRVTQPQARDLCLWMLQENPKNRPCFDEVMSHPFMQVMASRSVGIRFPSYCGLDLPTDIKYHFFLSHNQKEAGDIAHTLYERLLQMGLCVWYDQIATDLTVEGMARGVRQSKFFLLIATRNVFSRPFCRRELHECIIMRKPIVIINEGDDRFSPWSWDVWRSSPEYIGVPWQDDVGLEGPFNDTVSNTLLWTSIKELVSSAKDGAMPYRRRQYEANAMLFEMLRRCGMVEDLYDPGRPMELQHDPTRTVHQRHGIVLVVYTESTGRDIASTICDCLRKHCSAVTDVHDCGINTSTVEQAVNVVIILSDGLTQDAKLREILRMVAQRTDFSRTHLVQRVGPLGWQFGGEEHLHAGTHFQDMVKSIEALPFRPPDEPTRYEFDAMVEELRSRVHKVQ